MVEITLAQFVKDLKKFWTEIEPLLLKEKGEHCEFVIPTREALNNPAFSGKYGEKAIAKFPDSEMPLFLFLQQVLRFFLDSFENAPENVKKAIAQLDKNLGLTSDMYETLRPKFYAQDYIDRVIGGIKERKPSFFKLVRYNKGFKIRDMDDEESRRVIGG